MRKVGVLKGLLLGRDMYAVDQSKSGMPLLPPLRLGWDVMACVAGMCSLDAIRSVFAKLDIANDSPHIVL